MNDESIFAAAIAIPNPADRAAYLEKACAGSAALRQEVDDLLRAHAADNPLDRPPADLARTGDYQSDGPPPASVGDRIGPYRLMEQIGEGGFGLVFVAEQHEPVRRKVALKVLKPGMDTRDVVARFEAERQALALMDHPNIAKVFDAGSTSTGRPYFVMELVRGVPVTEFCDQQKLRPRDRLNLFVQVCQAVQHAHQKGVIHRDLKPSNVLVTVIDGVPVPKVIDFGVAKAVGQSLTEKTVYTRFAQMIGTPLYMSPEQAELSGVDVDTRSDVYALGVMLYELLTGTTPFDKDRFKRAAFDEIRRIIKEEEPPRPSTRLTSLGATLTAVSVNRGTEPGRLAGLVRGELDWIVMRALEKDRNRRYESAAGLAKDVQRYLADEVIEARPPTIGYRMRKVIRRHKAQVVVAAVLLLALLAGIVGTSWGLVQANRAEATARQEEQNALVDRDEKAKALIEVESARKAEAKTNTALEQALLTEKLAAYDMTIPLVQKAIQDSDPAQAATLLAKCDPEFRGWEWNFLSRKLDQNVVTLRPVNSNYHPSFQNYYRFTPDGESVVGVQAEGGKLIVQVWNTGTGKLEHSWDVGTGPSWRNPKFSVLSPDARRLAVWSYWPFKKDPAGAEPADDRTEVTIYDASSGRVLRQLTGHTGGVAHVLFRDDGQRIATGAADGKIRIWDDGDKPAVVLEGHSTRNALPFAFLPDGSGLVSVGRDREWYRTVPRFDPKANDLKKTEREVTATDELIVWDIPSGKPRVRGSFEAGLPTRMGPVPRMRVSPDGRYALLVDQTSPNGLFDLTTGTKVVHPGRERLWAKVDPPTDPQQWARISDAEYVGFADGGKTLLGYTSELTLNEFDVATGRPVTIHRLPVPATANPTGVYAYPVPGQANAPARGERRWAVGLSDDGTRFAAANISMGNRMTVVDTTTGYEVRSIPLRTLATGSGHTFEFSRDGSRLLTTDRTGEIRVWDLRDSATRRPLFPEAPPERGVQTPRVDIPLAVSRDGRFLAVQAHRGMVKLPGRPAYPGKAVDQIDLRTGRRIPMDFPGFKDSILHAEYSPDGRWIGILLHASKSLVADPSQHAEFYTAWVMDAAKGEISYHGKPIRLVRHDIQRRSIKPPRIGFTSDGTFLLASYTFATDGPAYSGHWDVEDVAVEKVVFSTPVGVDHEIQFVPGGARALVASRGGRYVEAWDLASRQRLWRVDATAGDAGQSSATFSPDGRRFLTCDVPAQFRVLNEPLIGVSRRATVRDAETGRVISTLTLPSVSNVGSFEFTPDGRRVLAYSDNATRQFATVYNVESGRSLLDLDGVDQTSTIAKGVFSPDGRYITQDWGPRRGGTGSKFRVWDGRADPPAWTSERSIDDLLVEARKLCEDPDSAKRNPAAAAALMAQAVAAYPGDYECLGVHGLALLLAGKDEEALAALTRQKDRMEVQASLIVIGAKNLGKTPMPKDRFPPLLVAQNEYLLAAAHHRLGHTAEARAAFDAAEERMGRPVILPNIASNVAAVGTPFPDVAQRPRAERHREIAIAILGIKDRPVPSLKVEAPKPFDEGEHPSARLNRAQFVVSHRNSDYATAVRIADEVLAGKFLDGMTYYNAACIYARASGIVKDAATKAQYADRAMEVLRQAVDNGFVEQNDGSGQPKSANEYFRTDEDLDPLRNRADYRKLEAEVAAKYPPREKGPPPREIRR